MVQVSHCGHTHCERTRRKQQQQAQTGWRPFVFHGSREEAAATSQTVGTERASERRNGPCTQLHGDRRWQGPGRDREMHCTATLRSMSPPTRLVPGTLRWTSGEDVGEAPAAERPAPLLEVLPQEWVQRRTVEQIVDTVPVVPMLHGFVLEQLVDILAPLDFRVAEQVIDVPKIVCPHRAARTASVRRRRWNSWWKYRRPYPFLRYCSGLLSRTLTFQLLVVVELVEVFPVSPRTEFCSVVEQNR